MLNGHGSRYHCERFIGDIEAMPAGEGVALQPPLAEMLAEHLHHSSISRDMVVNVQPVTDEAPILYGEDVVQPIRIGFIWAEEPEVRLPVVGGKDITQP